MTDAERRARDERRYLDANDFCLDSRNCSLKTSSIIRSPLRAVAGSSSTVVGRSFPPARALSTAVAFTRSIHALTAASSASIVPSSDSVRNATPAPSSLVLATTSPRSLRKSSTLPGSPNHPYRSATRCWVWHPGHRTMTTPLSYAWRLNPFAARVSHRPHVNIMYRSFRADDDPTSALVPGPPGGVDPGASAALASDAAASSTVVVPADARSSARGTPRPTRSSPPLAANPRRRRGATPGGGRGPRRGGAAGTGAAVPAGGPGAAAGARGWDETRARRRARAERRAREAPRMTPDGCRAARRGVSGKSRERDRRRRRKHLTQC